MRFKSTQSLSKVEKSGFFTIFWAIHYTRWALYREVWWAEMLQNFIENYFFRLKR